MSNVTGVTTAASRLQGVVRGFLLSLRIEGETAPLAVLERMLHGNAALLRDSPALRQALAGAASEIFLDVPISPAARISQSVSVPKSGTTTSVNPRLPSRSLAGSRVLQSKSVIRAAKSRLSNQQPSPESRASSNARGKNYSARSAKRTRLSGSPASSKKRSSTA